MLLYFLKFPLKASMILYWGKAQNYVLKKESLVLMVGWGDRIKKTNKKNGKTGLDSVSLAASGPACKPFHSRRHRAA